MAGQEKAERDRLDVLLQHQILDTPAEQAFDDLTRLAAQICKTPVALISLVDRDRQWFKSRIGLDFAETPRDVSFCAQAMYGADLMVVGDARGDPRFATNPLVVGEPHFRFYAGAPLQSAERQPLGTLCVLDYRPRELTAEQFEALRALSRQAMTLLDLRRRSEELVEENLVIRQRELIDRAVHAAEYRWRTIVAAEPECVKLLDEQGCLLEMNPAGLAMIEASRFEQVAGLCVYPLILGEHRDAFRDLNERAFRGESGELEFELQGLHGTRRWLHSRVVPLRDEASTITAALSVTRDVTGRKQSEGALRTADRERAELIDSIDGIVWEADAETLRFTFVSHQAERLLGYPIAQWSAEPDFWIAHLHAEDREGVVADCVAATGAGRAHALEYRMIAADGRVVWLHDSVGTPTGTPPKVRGLMVDITERKARETALMETGERYVRQRGAIAELTRSRVVQNPVLGIALREITESAARVLGVERVSVWRFNQSRTAIACHDLFEATPAQHSAGLELAAADFPGYFRAIATSEILAADDAVTDVRTCEFADAYLRPLGIVAMLDAPIQVDGEVDGVLCHEHIGAPRVWAPDELSFAVSVGTLVSLAIAQSERRQIEQRFRQSQKMDAFGQLAGGVAHDFNNILAAVMMQASDAAGVEGTPAYVQDALADIEIAAERGASLTRQLLAFSRRQIMQLRTIDLNAVVTSLAQMLRRILGADVRVEVDLDPSALLTNADPGMMDQVLMNFAVNARDAMPDGGHLRIATTARVLDEHEARSMIDTAAGRYVCLHVTDSGCGIPPENLRRIFEPFFTTKEPGKGTGLGLATVFGIVKQHHGVVQVASEVGRGTTFTVMLPASEADEIAAPKPGAPTRPRGGTETILVVEDDPQVRKLMCVLLERRGYRVLDAGTGAEALSLWDSEHGAHVLLTDIVMPGMSGRELAMRLKQRDPRLKVIFISGYSAELAGRDLILQEGENFLQKPCPPDIVLETVRRCLDGGS